MVPEQHSSSARWKYAYSTGATTALDIATSNLALLFVTVSFYTVAKTTTLAWTLIWATLFKLEPCRLRTFFIVLLIVGGLILATEGERHQTCGFSVVGTILVLVAACLGGARWCLTQALFAHEHACAVRILWSLVPRLAGRRLDVATDRFAVGVSPFVVLGEVSVDGGRRPRPSPLLVLLVVSRT